MAKLKQNRFKSDQIGKALAIKFFNHFGYYVTLTTDPMDELDGSILTPDGKIIGLEVKEMRPWRYRFHDILLAQNKYEYANGAGKEKSGLTATVKFDYVPFDDADKDEPYPKNKDTRARKKYGFNLNDIIVFVTPFSAADGLDFPLQHFQDENVDEAEKGLHPIANIPRSKSEVYKITDVIERAQYENGQIFGYDSDVTTLGLGILGQQI